MDIRRSLKAKRAREAKDNNKYIMIAEAIRGEKENKPKYKKCAIYNRFSVKNDEAFEKTRQELIKYCEESLGITDYVIFEEVASVKAKRKVFDEMIDRIHHHEFSDVLVKHPNRLYRAEYNREKFDDIVFDITRNGANIVSIADR